MIVYKFGGASIKDATGIKNIAKIVQKTDENLVIIVSAIGKTTAALEKLANAFFYDNKKVDKIFNEIANRHNKIVTELFSDVSKPVFLKVANEMAKLDSILQKDCSMNFDFDYDQIVSFGEIFSSIIVSEYFNDIGVDNNWIDIKHCLKTDDTYREAKVIWDLSSRLMKKTFNFDNSSCFVTQGFIGSTINNLSTTLGLEGSDFTAAVVAYILNGSKVTIWKDVAGVFNADPKWYSNAVKLNGISYREAIELAYFGAKVIHPKTIKPLQNKNIPLYVKSFINPDNEGTIVINSAEYDKYARFPNNVPIFIQKLNQILISISPKDFSFIVEQNLSKIYATLYRYRIKVNLMQNSAINFSICVDNTEAKLSKLIKELESEFKLLYNNNLELITIRHYSQNAINEMTTGRKILVEQKSRHTARFVLQNSLEI